MRHLVQWLLLATATGALADPLPSWNETSTKKALVAFVDKVTTAGSPDYVVPAERIAVFDNDGTLWSEQPAYFQAFYIVDRIKALAPEHPEWQETEPFASVLKGDLKGALAGGEKAILEMAMATHAGITAEAFQRSVRDWLASARHPQSGRRYDQMVFQPMLELLTFLRAKDFKTFIVSGGGIDFLRVFAEETYGIPPEQVIGSSIKADYEVRESGPLILKVPEIDFIDDKAGKPVAIHQHIGRRPLAAFGNSDGDFQMLEWTTAGEGARLGLLVHHDDADREFSYDRDSPIGGLARGLDEGPDRHWLIVSMKNDWSRVFPQSAP